MMPSNDNSEAKINPVSDAALSQRNSIDNQATRGTPLTPISTDHSNLHELVAPEVKALKANLQSADSSAIKQKDTNVEGTVKSSQETTIQRDITSSIEQSATSWSISSLLKGVGRHLEYASEVALCVVGLGLCTFGAANLGLSAICWAASKTLTAIGADSPYLLQSLVTESANYGFPAILLGLCIAYALSDVEMGRRLGRSN